MSTSSGKSELCGSNLRLKTNDIDSALLYTPLTTAVPTGPILDFIPQPVLQPVYSTALQLSEPESTWIKESLNSQDSWELKSQDNQLLHEHLRQVVTEVNMVDVSFLQFKDQTCLDELQKGSTSQEEATFIAQARVKLGQFASSLLDQMNASCRYTDPTPTTPSSKTQSTIDTEQSFDHDIVFPSSPPGFDMEASTTSCTSQTIASPISFPEFRKTTRATPANLSNSNTAVLLLEDIVTPTKLAKDDKIKGKDALKEFQSLCEDIFEADDSYVPDNPISKSNGIQIFWCLGTELDKGPCLCLEIMVRLEKLILHINKLKRSKDVSTFDLLRIQKISQRSISFVSDDPMGSIHFQDESGIDQLLRHINRNENALVASSLILTIAQNYTEKQLCSEELLLTTAEYIKFLVEKSIQPMISGDIKESNPAYFAAAYIHRKYLTALVQHITHIISSFGKLESLSENIITVLEFLAMGLIFVDNGLKDASAIFSLVMVESLRVTSMDMICSIFARYEDQRGFIIEELLGNLSKLPSSHQKARQFALNSGKHVQLISALLLQLVQSFSQTVNIEKSFSQTCFFIDESSFLHRESSELTRFHNHLMRKVSIASENATQTSHRIVSWIVAKVFKEPKSGTSENPHKALFEILVDDLILMQPSSDWPAAELMLEFVVKYLVSHIDDDRNHAVTRGFALDSLANIMNSMRRITIEAQTELAEKNLGFLNIPPISEMNSETDIVQWDYMMERCFQVLQQSINTHPRARDGFQFLIIRLLNDVFQARENIGNNTNSSLLQRVTKAIHTLATIMFNPFRMSTHLLIESERRQPVQTAYHSLLSTWTTCRSFDSIMQRIIQQFEAPQIILRTKALKALGHISMSDPSVLSRTWIKPAVAARMSDSSPQVRDSALDLVGKYVQSGLAKGYLQYIIERLNDPGLNVRKRAICLLKDLYIRGNQEVKVEIALRLIPCMSDSEEGVRELSSKTIDELWFGLDTIMTSSKSKEFFDKVEVIIKSVSKLGRFNSLISDLIREKSKTQLDWLRTFVNSIYDQFLWRQSREDKTEEKIECLSLISTIVRGAPLTIDPSHLVSLQVELESKDQTVLYLVLTIYRLTLPSLQNISKAFLISVQKTLLGKITTFVTRVLKEAIPVICIVSEKTNDLQRITATILSCLNGLHTAKNFAIRNEVVPYSRNLALLLALMGLFGQSCDLNRVDLDLGKLLENSNFDSVNDYMVDTITLFCKDCCAEDIQKSAIQGLCLLCSTWSSLFLKPCVLTTIDRIFSSNNNKLQIALLKGFHEYLLLEEQRVTENKNSINGAVFNIGNQDFGVATSLMQRYLDPILGAAKGKDLQLSLVAIQVIGSIVTGGLANPRNCMGTIIALQTSPDLKIHEISLMLHTDLSSKHESLIETCCVPGVKSVFVYQKSITGHTLGFIEGPTRISHLTALYKLINRTSKKKFFHGLVNSLGLDPANSTITLEDVQYTKFVAEALSCLDFGSLEEVLLIVQVLDRHFAIIADSILQSIDSVSEGKKVDCSLLHGAVLYSALLVLKRHLKQVYGLSERKCRAYDYKKVGISKDAKAVKHNSSLLLSWDQVPGVLRGTRDIADYETFRLLMNEKPSFKEFAVEDAILSLEGTFLNDKLGQEIDEASTPRSRSGKKRRKTQITLEDSPTKKRKSLWKKR